MTKKSKTKEHLELLDRIEEPKREYRWPDFEWLDDEHLIELAKHPEVFSREVLTDLILELARRLEDYK